MNPEITQIFPNLHLLFLRFFIVVQEINYPSCLLRNKTKKKVSHLVTPSITQQTQPFPSEFDESPFGRIRPLSILREQREKIRWHDRREFIPSGWNWIVYGFCHKSFTNHSIDQKHSHCIANYSKSGVIGYSGRKLPWKLLTIVYKGKPLPRSPFVCSC